MTSVFFNNFSNFGEQTLFQDLIVEALSIYGVDMLYIPKIGDTIDRLLFEDDTVKFEKSYPIDVYVKTYDGFEGDGNFMSKFGLEIRDQTTFTIATRSFQNDVGRHEGFIRPREGDLFYYPLNRKIFEIKYVEDKPFHYQFGMLPTYDMYCELYQYSEEKFDTGIDDVDRIVSSQSLNMLDYAISAGSGKYLTDQSGNPIVTEAYKPDNFDPFGDNQEIKRTADGIVDFSEINPFSESTN